MKKLIKALALLLTSTILLTGCGGTKTELQEEKKVESKKGETTNNELVQIKILRAWNGSSSMAPDPQQDVVNKYLREKFNAEIVWDFVQGSEVEQLNLMFASGDMPDVIDFPFWGGSGGETGIVKRAAIDGLLMPIDDYMTQYAPKLKERMYNGCTQDYIEFDLNAPQFEGEHYIIPRETVNDPKAFTQNFAYGLYIRKDIAQSLGVNVEDPNFIKDSEALYKLLTDIKTGGYKDINGNSVIVASSGARGWMSGLYLNEWYDGGVTEFYLDEEGKPRLDILKVEEENASTLFMRKLVSEGLFDKEIFSQENADLEAKVANGSIAVIASSANHLYEMTDRTIAKSHPEMQYIPLPSVINQAGERVTGSQTVAVGRGGSPAFAITSTAGKEKVQKFLEILEFINSTPEGYNLVNYGIEGETFEIVDNVPKFLSEIQAKADEDFTNIAKMGLQVNYNTFVIADEKPYGVQVTSALEQAKIEAGKILPLKFVDGIRFSKFSFDYSDAQSISMIIEDYSKLKQSAYFATSDSEAINILNKFRQKTEKQLQAYTEYVTQKASESGKQNIVY